MLCVGAGGQNGSKLSLLGEEVRARRCYLHTCSERLMMLRSKKVSMMRGYSSLRDQKQLV